MFSLKYVITDAPVIIFVYIQQILLVSWDMKYDIPNVREHE